MPRIDLAVPSAEKNAAKQFTLPVESVRSSSYFIAQASTSCRKCRQSTSVYGFVLPAWHETLDPVGKDDEVLEWCRYDVPTMVHYVTDLLPAAVARMETFTPHYKVDSSKTTQGSYWMNHCEHCGVRQDDFPMYCQPGGVFCPPDVEAADKIILSAVAESFACCGNTIYGDYTLFERMRRA